MKKLYLPIIVPNLEKIQHQLLKCVSETYFTSEPKAYSDTRWINHSTGLTFDRTVDFIVKFRQELGKSNKFKFGEFDYGHLRSLGITEEDLMTLSKNEIQDKYYIRELIEEKRQRYLKQLDSYINK